MGNSFSMDAVDVELRENAVWFERLRLVRLENENVRLVDHDVRRAADVVGLAPELVRLALGIFSLALCL
jgi:hypothetical protein